MLVLSNVYLIPSDIAGKPSLVARDLLLAPSMSGNKPALHQNRQSHVFYYSSKE